VAEILVDDVVVAVDATDDALIEKIQKKEG